MMAYLLSIGFQNHPLDLFQAQSCRPGDGERNWEHAREAGRRSFSRGLLQQSIALLYRLFSETKFDLITFIHDTSTAELNKIRHDFETFFFE
jgi:hypothetical protein